MKLSASKQSILSHVESQFYAKKMSYTLTSNKGKLSASETERLTEMDFLIMIETTSISTSPPYKTINHRYYVIMIEIFVSKVK